MALSRCVAVRRRTAEPLSARSAADSPAHRWTRTAAAADGPAALAGPNRDGCDHASQRRAEGRRRQWPQLLAALRVGQTPLILLGDFNSPSSSPELRETIRGLGLRQVRPKPSLPTIAHGGRIDHIFINLPAERSALVRDSRASDHRPVFARLNETEIPLRSR
ncbi:endonuclease/exonuclease/phosphatase family protein [Paenibacillus sp. A3]|uniref:endonuclease/exonuclease/phosphatase family protein n=1 Tax=Paenibacillus sp. A3 TaxID=1337054 RepID=UPI00138EF34E